MNESSRANEDIFSICWLDGSYQNMSPSNNYTRYFKMCEFPSHKAVCKQVTKGYKTGK